MKLSDGVVSQSDNLVFLGRLTDCEIKALMENCYLFVHPAFYEGFGITPLEALACGANILVSRAGSLPEIYKDVASFIDPKDTNFNFSNYFATNSKQQIDLILKRYTWQRNASIIYSSLRKYLD